MVVDCTLSGNSSGGNGGGIANRSGGTVQVTGSTLSGNSAGADGGAIYNLATLSVGSSTFSGNSPDAIANFGTYNDLGGNTFN